MVETELNGHANFLFVAFQFFFFLVNELPLATQSFHKRTQRRLFGF